MSMRSDAVRLREKDYESAYADAHCHLVPEWFTKDDISEISKKADKNGIKIIINSTIDPAHYQFGLETTEHDSIYLSVGVEPAKISDERINDFIQFFNSNKDKIVAIGEIGLDFHWIKEPEMQMKQETHFNSLIDFAIENDKPIVVHSRGAETRAIEILKQKGAEDVLMHCFEGTEEQAREISTLSWYATVPTSTIYRKSFQKILKSVSIDSLMLETDSPFHSLEKDEQNTPSSIPILCKHAARMLEIDEQDLAEITYNNTKTFYRI